MESLSPVIFTEPDLIPELLGVVAFSSSEVAALCHFFNIENPSSDDKMFLLIARRHGFAEATRLQVGLKWKCESTARRLYNLVNGSGVED